MKLKFIIHVAVIAALLSLGACAARTGVRVGSDDRGVGVGAGGQVRTY